jgi:cytochrome c-type biogenesis protein CcmE
VDYEQGHKTLLFTMVDDKNDRMRVAYSDVRPPNFEMATQITAIGAYDGDTFRADKLLVKCPSKYQGTDQEGETKEYSAAAALARQTFRQGRRER